MVVVGWTSGVTVDTTTLNNRVYSVGRTGVVGVGGFRVRVLREFPSLTPGGRESQKGVTTQV